MVNAGLNPTVASHTVLGSIANQLQHDVPKGINLTPKAATIKRVIQRQVEAGTSERLSTPKRWESYKYLVSTQLPWTRSNSLSVS